MYRIALVSWLSFSLGLFAGLYFKSEPKVKESQFITDSNGCQYFKKSERPRLNPNGTQICKPL